MDNSCERACTSKRLIVFSAIKETGLEMQLTHFAIQDYRSITKAVFDELANVTTLIGPNNEGKSNILEAIKICLELLRSEQIVGGSQKVRIRVAQSSYDWESDYPVKKQNSNPEGVSTFDLHFQLSGDEAIRFQSVVKSKLNGILPIQLRFNSGPYVEFRVAKPGKGGAALSKKGATICRFISENLDFAHVPAIRTAETSQELVNDLVARELRLLERDVEYSKLQAQLTALQKPILDSIALKIKENLKGILGKSLKQVDIKLPTQRRLRAIARSAQITIDDGAATSLERKGDGVKSLVAIGLLTKALQESESAKDIILLIEEPESHLHPKAVHQLKEVLDGLKQDRQIILTTHCPLLINRANVPSNIIVSRNKAVPAQKLEELRDILGVQASDNLRHAALILVVEGSDDSIALQALFSHHSSYLRGAIASGSLAFETLGGASKLRYSLAQLQTVLCNYYVLLDDDEEGRKAFKEVSQEGLASAASVSFTKCRGLSEAEFEDLLDEKVYAPYFQITHGVNVTMAPFNEKKKWSARIRSGLQRSGKSDANGEAWSDAAESRDKLAIAQLVAANPGAAILTERLPMLTALISAVESALKALAT